jgi:hypothetical protein
VRIADRCCGTPDVAVGPTGEPLAVWGRNIETSSGEFSSVIEASRLVNGRWTTPTRLSNAGETSSEPRIAIDGSGAATVIWSGPTQRIQAVHRPSAGRFSRPQTIATTPARSSITGVDMAVNRDGDTVVGWARTPDFSRAQMLAVTRPSRGVWTTPFVLSGSRNVSLESDATGVAIGPCGRGVVAWADRPADAGDDFRTRVRLRRMANCMD